MPQELLGMIDFNALTTALVWGFAAALAAIIFLNRGDSMFINLSAQEEAGLLGLGVVGFIYGMAATSMLALVFGLVIAAVGIVALSTDLIDL